MAQARFALVALLALAQLGCTIAALLLEPIYGESTPPVDQAAQLHLDDLRWGRVIEAAQPVEPEQRAEFLALFDDPDRPFRFTSVEIVSAEPAGEDGEEWDVLVAYEYYRPPAVLERKLRQKQHWRYDGDTDRWMVAPDLEVFAR